MVHLGHERDVPPGQSFDQPHLPERAVAVELVAVDVGGELGQFVHPAGRGERGSAQVVVDVEVRVVDPDRMTEAEGDLDQPAVEHRGEGDALGDQRAQPAEGVPAPDRGGVEDRGHRHVHVQRWRLHVQEAGVEPGQSLCRHVAPWPSLPDTGHVALEGPVATFRAAGSGCRIRASETTSTVSPGPAPGNRAGASRGLRRFATTVVGDAGPTPGPADWALGPSIER